jgi:putative effector of murein hydrolase
MSEVAALTAWLSSSPLAWLALTVGVWCVADGAAAAAGRHPLANPLLISVVVILVLLKATGTSYAVYSSGVQFIEFLIGPAIVAIAVPLFGNWSTVRSNALPIAAALLVGSVTAIASAVIMGRMVGLPETITLSLVPKSATTGVAMAISQSLGGEPTMTSTFTVTTSIIAAVLLVSFMRLLRIRDPAVIGFAAGLSAHSVGTARAFQLDPVAGTFSGVALCLNAILTAVIAPMILAILR